MNSEELFKRAERVLPGGVNSPVRSFQAVGGTPFCVTEARGAFLRTADGAELLDFCMSWGPLILGHADSDVVKAVQDAAAKGLSYGTNHPGEAELAEMILSCIPSADKIRFVSSGTEAVMTAVRMARGAVNRTRILKFEGCYHGHADAFLAGAGSGVLSGGRSASEGVPQKVTEETHVLPYNDMESVRSLFRSRGEQMACVIVEPVAGNMGVVLPSEGFLEELRALTEQYGALLVFDEVITGFRLAPGVYSTAAGINPDLTVLGKIIGGGLPIGAVAGPRSLMDVLAPEGGVYQAGTLSGNPLSMAAGTATVKKLLKEGRRLYEALSSTGEYMASKLEKTAASLGVSMPVARAGSMFTPFFRSSLPENLEESRESDGAAYSRFFHHMLKRGFYMPPSPFETWFLSAAHSSEHIDSFVRAMESLEIQD